MTDYIRKNITIKKRHEDFIQNRHISLSGFVQEKLDERMGEN